MLSYDLNLTRKAAFAAIAAVELSSLEAKEEIRYDQAWVEADYVNNLKNAAADEKNISKADWDTVNQLLMDIEQNGFSAREHSKFESIEAFYSTADREKAFEATRKAIDIAAEAGDIHDFLTSGQINKESLAFLSDSDVKSYLESLIANGQEFHISFYLAERFSKPAIRALAKSARMNEENSYYEPLEQIINETKDDELSGDLVPSTEGGRLCFAIYLDGPDAPRLKGSVKQMQHREKDLQASNPQGLRYVARKNILEGIFNALQMKEQGKLGDDDTRREKTYTRNIDQALLSNGRVLRFRVSGDGDSYLDDSYAYVESGNVLGVTVKKILT
ncbi:hypothetical protein FWC31_00870 [Candidatus Saccharibacteria bacterium]|nr:hypothetical protein [Candidatus Saccharibacteria bacterium]